MSYPKLIEELIQQLTQLPGVGRRSAERMVFWFLNNSKEHSESLSKSIMQLKDGLRLCKECNNLAEGEICRACDDPRRDRKTLCIVEDHKHLLAIERTGIYRGLYYVLLGAINPSEGRGPEDLNLQPVLDKARSGQINEVIIATDPDTEGEMTALHLIKLLRNTGVTVSRIGLGIPVGSSVEYADLSTLSMSMNMRREIGEGTKT